MIVCLAAPFRCVPVNFDIRRRTPPFLMRALLTLSVVVAVATAAHAEGQVYVGPGFGFGVTPPPQWTESRPSFAAVLFSPAGSAPDDSPTVIYVRPVAKAPLKVGNAAEMNALDLRGMKSKTPTVKSRKLDPIRSTGGSSAEVYEFTGGKYHELVAYADQGKTMVLFVLSSEKSPPTASDKNAWRELVRSYRWLPELTGR